MKELLLHRKNKKGVSEIVGYVLLIIIAVGLSVLVFAYLRIYLPKEKAICDKEVSLILDDYTCKVDSAGLDLNITLRNNGLFNISAAYLRIAPPDKKIRPLLNDRNVYFTKNLKSFDLSPAQSYNQIYSTNLYKTAGDYELEIEPAILSGKSGRDLALCDKAVIVQRISCHT